MEDSATEEEVGGVWIDPEATVMLEAEVELVAVADMETKAAVELEACEDMEAGKEAEAGEEVEAGVIVEAGLAKGTEAASLVAGMACRFTGYNPHARNPDLICSTLKEASHNFFIKPVMNKNDR